MPNGTALEQVAGYAPAPPPLPPLPRVAYQNVNIPAAQQLVGTVGPVVQTVDQFSSAITLISTIVDQGLDAATLVSPDERMGRF